MRAFLNLVLLLCLSSLPASVVAIDLEPGDVAVPEFDIKTIQVGLSYRRFDQFYQRGNREDINPELHRAELQFRYGQAFSIGNNRAYFYAQLPVGSVQPKGDLRLRQTQNSSGIGDLALLFAFWPYANYETRTFFGIGGYLILPTGEYDHQRTFNMGGNRTLTALQLGYQKQVVADLHWQSALDVLRYGKNSDFGSDKRRLDQRPLYSAQTGLQYFLTPQTAVSASYFYSQGGERRLNREGWHNRLETHRYKLSIQHTQSVHRITAQFGQDLKIHNGLKEAWQASLKYSYFFQ